MPDAHEPPRGNPYSDRGELAVNVRRSKIVCTLGPSSDSLAAIRGLIEAGMDVARLNFSHGTHEEHARRAALVSEASDAVGKTVAILQDLRGPKIRSGRGSPRAVAAGDVVTLIEGSTGDDQTLAVEYPGWRLICTSGT